MSASLVVLGPQRTDIRVGEVARRLVPTGPVATITAGWQERETEDREFDQILDGRSANLRLYTRALDVEAADPELAAAHRALQAEVRELRRLYELRLGHAMDSWIELMSRNGSRFAERERDDAAEAVRRLDARHLEGVQELRRQFDETYRPRERPAVQKHLRELEVMVNGSAAVAVAGGHVAVLLNRLRMFGMGELLRGRTVICWSAGAMALATTVVLFHDRPPQGQGNAEAFERGLGILPGIVPLPHGSWRLDLGDGGRIQRFVRRFGDQACIVLDPGVELTWNGSGWSTPGALRLDPEGHAGETRGW